MYNIDYDKKEISRIVDNKLYTRELRSPRDSMKYRVFSCKLLLSYKERKGFNVYHFLPRDMHEYASNAKMLNNNKRITDVKVYREYFIGLIKELIKYCPDFQQIIDNLELTSTIKMYRDFDNTFRYYTKSDPIFIGMAVALELRISTYNGNKISFDTVNSLISNEQFKMDKINNETGFVTVDEKKCKKSEIKKDISYLKDQTMFHCMCQVCNQQ